MPTNSYANPNPIYQPAMRIITAISNSNPVSVTTSFAHQYNTGLIVRLDIPLNYGMQTLNQQFGPLTVTSPTTFTLPIDTSSTMLFAPFAVPANNPGHNYTDAQVVPIGSISSDIYLATRNILP
jgi:hypothetical protein